MTLRQGDEIDTGYSIKTLDDVAPLDWQTVTDGELEKYHWGLNYLDPYSWQFYLPAFMRYSICHISLGESLVTVAFINTLIPERHETDQFTFFSEEQRRVIVAALEFLSYDEESQVDSEAYEVLFDHWSSSPE